MVALKDLTGTAAIIQSVVALLALFGVGGAVKSWFSYRWKKRLRKSTSTFRLGFLVAASLHHARRSLGAHRAMVIEAHNGGDDISVSRPVYTSVRHQVTDDELPQIDWVGEPLDEDYWRLLRDVENSGDGFVYAQTSKLKTDSKLRSLYEAQGVVGAYVFRLFAEPESYWFCSMVVTGTSHTPTPAITREVIRSARTELVRYLRDEKE